jgi:cobyrinic acid a,c-diamide synthase
MAALHRKGMSVAPFKVGPDFIDPGHHTHIVGRPSRNLDGWMLDEVYNKTHFQCHAAQCDVVVVEGVMGLFDGFSGRSEAGSTAQMAKWLNLPVLLVVNAASMARSAAALVSGFEQFDPKVRFAGVIFNHLGSKGHLAYLREAMEAYVEMPLLGGLLRHDALEIPERYLGLATAQERPLVSQQVDQLADQVEAAVDIDRLVDLLPEITVEEDVRLDAGFSKKTGVRFGVARDKAFCFYYPENLELLTATGLELVFFSPLEDTALPENLDGLYFGGGYPELFAHQLSDNLKMRQMIANLSRKGMPIYGECGGFMYLCRDLEDGAGEVHAMCNCFPFRTRMHAELRSLGYRKVRLDADTILGCCGQLLRGHEFHYSGLVEGQDYQKIRRVYRVEGRKGRNGFAEGYQINQTLGSYIHLHFGSRSETARDFATACRRYRKEAGHETP